MTSSNVHLMMIDMPYSEDNPEAQFRMSCSCGHEEYFDEVEEAAEAREAHKQEYLLSN